jgi:transposase-like protein
MRGKKGIKHSDPKDPPRRRANAFRGHGNWDNDRPPIVGVVGRGEGQVYLRVLHRANAAELEPLIARRVAPGATVNTDKFRSYSRLAEQGHPHPTVDHGAGEYARDDDGDGVREVHVNTTEGLWTGARNFLRVFRGVNKVYLQQYASVYQWTYNAKQISPELLRRFFTSPPRRKHSNRATTKKDR